MLNPAVDPEQAARANQAEPQQSKDAAQPTEPDADDQSPLSSISIEPAENKGAIVTHHHKVSDRVKNMGHHEPTRHVTRCHAELMKHLEKHS